MDESAPLIPKGVDFSPWIAALGGITASILGGIAWASVVISTNTEVGYAALGIGFLAGFGVYFGSGRNRSLILQQLALVCALFGLVCGKYFIVAHILQVRNPTIGYLDPRVAKVFLRVLPHIIRPVDFLWLFIALRVAWRIPKPLMTKPIETAGTTVS